MNEERSSAKAASGKLRIALWIVGGLAGLVVVAYFIATSSAVLKAIVLPKASQALGAKVSAEGISASPLLGSLAIRGLTVQPEGGEPILSVQEARARFRLWSILGGHYEIGEVTVTAPVLNIVQTADGKNNLDSLMKEAAKRAATSPAKPAGAPGAFQLALRQVSVKDGRLRYVKQGAGGADQAEISGLNLTVDRVENGQSGKIGLEAAIKYELRSGTNAAAPSVLQGKLSATYACGLGPDLTPQTVSGSARFEVVQAQGAWADAAALAAVLECALTPKNVEKLNLRFEKAGAALGQLNVSGPFDATKKEGRLKIELLSINRQVLNLAGAATGLDFAKTTLNATNTLDLSQRGNILFLKGQWLGSQLGFSVNGRATPPADLDLSYQISVDFGAQSFLLQNLALAGKLGGRDFLTASLDHAMNLNWGRAQAEFQEASVVMAVTNLNLADWGFVAGSNAPAGVVGLTGKVTAQKDGKLLLANFDFSVRDPAVRAGTNRIGFSLVQGRIQSRLEEYRNLTLENYTLEARDGANVTLSVKGDGDYAAATGKSGIRAVAEANLPVLLGKYPVPQLNCATGTVKLNLLYAQEPKQQHVKGSATVNDFNGVCAGYRLLNYTAGVDGDLELKDGVAHLYNAKFTAKDNYNAGGACTVAGTYDLTKQTAQFTFNSIDLNQFALGPFLAPWIQPVTLTRFSITSEGAGSYAPNGPAALKGTLKMLDLTLADPSRKLPSAPLSFEVAVDAEMKSTNEARIGQLLLTLGNEKGGTRGGTVGLSGNVDWKGSNARLAYGLTNINEKGLAGWLEPMLAPRKLASLNLNGSGTLEVTGGKEGRCKTSLSVSNLVVAEAGTTNATNPLEGALSFDGILRDRVLELSQALLALKPTALASNRVEVSGRVDLSHTNVYSGQLTAQADSLDLNPAWQMFTRTNSVKAANTTVQTGAKIPAKTPGTPIEPAAVVLPLQQFGVDVKVGRLFMGELAVTNLLATVKINGGDVRVDPFGCNLNGGPVNGSVVLNLGVAGWTYDVGLQATNVPVEPLVNTFMPKSKGLYQGNVVVDTRLKGAGITDPSIQTNLSGQVGFTFTNANIVLVSAWYKSVLTPVVTILRVPEVLNSPLNAVTMQARVGQGTVNVQPFVVFTPSFQASSTGTVTLASVLTNSALNFPVDVALQRAVAQKANLIPANAPTNTAFVLLPSFVQVKGTLLAPKPEIQGLEIAKLGLKSIVGLPQFMGTKAVNALSGVSDLFEGKSSVAQTLQGFAGTNAVNAASATNTTATKALDLLNTFLPQKSADTGAVKTATNAASAVNLATNLLNTLRRGATSQPTSKTNSK